MGLPSGARPQHDSEILLPNLCDPPDADDIDEGEKRRRDWHMRMLRHPMGEKRRLLKPSRDLNLSLKLLEQEAPQFQDVLKLIANANMLALATGTALRLPPILLTGEPGIGKTWFLRKLAGILGTQSLTLAMNLMTDRGSTLTGLSSSWRAAAPGKIAKTLLEGETASPLIMLDEIDKISPINPAETPIEALHSLLELENARAFIDEFIDIEIDASLILWFASANDTARLPASILDRFVVFAIRITDGQRRQLHQNIFEAVNASHGGRFSVSDASVFDLVSDCSPRAMTRLWPVVFGCAVRLGQRDITATAMRMALDLLDTSADRIEIGFISRQSTRSASLTTSRG